mgnify:CR=1 FL=1
MCLCVRVSVCNYACTHVRVCVCMRARLRVCVNACVRACVHACVRACVRACVPGEPNTSQKERTWATFLKTRKKQGHVPTFSWTPQKAGTPKTRTHFFVDPPKSGYTDKKAGTHFWGAHLYKCEPFVFVIQSLSIFNFFFDFGLCFFRHPRHPLHPAIAAQH